MSRAGSSYLVLLEGILSNPKSIQVAANLSVLPRASNAISETRDTVFYCFSGNSKQSIEKLLSRKSPRSNPCLSNYSKPKKRFFRQPRFIRPSAWIRLCHNIELSSKSKLGHDLATTLSFVKPYRLLTTSGRIPCVVFLLWHTRRFGSSYLPSLVKNRTSYLDAGKHLKGLDQVARQI